MKLLETSYLVDYEQGHAEAEEYFSAHEHAAFGASTISMFELAFGVVWDSDRDLGELRDSLRWVDFLRFTVADAIEGARIQGELQSAAERIPVGDMVIAAVARNRGATLVAADAHFERIDGLDIEYYRD